MSQQTDTPEVEAVEALVDSDVEAETVLAEPVLGSEPIVPAGSFVAQVDLKVAVEPDGTEVWRRAGEAVPEAAGWSPVVLDAHLHQGQIIYVSPQVASLTERVSILEAAVALLTEQATAPATSSKTTRKGA